MTRNRIIVGLVAIVVGLLIAASLAWGAPLDTDIHQPETSTAAYRANIGPTADTTQLVDTVGGLSTIGSITTLTVSAATTYAVSGRFSTASATCVVHFTRYEKDGTAAPNTILTGQDSTEGTLTADATITWDGTVFKSNTLYFDSGGSEVIKIVIEAPSGGTLDLWARKVGYTR